MRHVILDVAAETGAVDVADLTSRLDTGWARAAVFAHFASAGNDRVTCSPHIFLADGTNQANPGVEVHWLNGGFGEGYPVIDSDDPTVYEALLARAAALADLKP